MLAGSFISNTYRLMSIVVTSTLALMCKMKNVITRVGEASYMVPSDSRGVNFSLEDSFTRHDKRPGKNDVIGCSPFLPDVIATYRTPGRGTTVDNVRLF